jgi:hypothetical protein
MEKVTRLSQLSVYTPGYRHPNLVALFNDTRVCELSVGHGLPPNGIDSANERNASGLDHKGMLEGTFDVTIFYLAFQVGDVLAL